MCNLLFGILIHLKYEESEMLGIASEFLILGIRWRISSFQMSIGTELRINVKCLICFLNLN